MNKKYYLITAIIIAIFVVIIMIPKNKLEEKEISSFESCIEAGYTILESYPEQCRTPDGIIFVRDIGNELEKMDLIRVDNPRPGQIIESPLVITGEARGFWFFEADFPIRFYDQDGNEINLAIATALDGWMTENFVPFSAEITFDATQEGKGALVFEKDNPSGLPENDDSLTVPIKFNNR